MTERRFKLPIVEGPITDREMRLIEQAFEAGRGEVESLRDTLAGRAMQALIPCVNVHEPGIEWTVAEMADRFADALLARRRTTDAATPAEAVPATGRPIFSETHWRDWELRRGSRVAPPLARIVSGRGRRKV